MLGVVCWMFAPVPAPADPPTTTLAPVTISGNQSVSGVKNFTSLQVNGVTQFHTPQDYGAKGDGTSHLLNTVFGSLAAAQAAFPVSISGCTYSGASTTIVCADATFLSSGMMVSGSGIPSGATVASVTDSTHFVLSASPTGSGSSVALTSSFVTDISQDTVDFAGLQQSIWVNGSIFIPAGAYVTNKTLKVKSPLTDLSVKAGITISGAGVGVTEIIVAAGVTGMQVMEGHCLLRDFRLQAISDPDGKGSSGAGILLSTGATEQSPPNYTPNANFNHLYIDGFAQGIYNLYKFDEVSLFQNKFRDCGAAVKTVGNLDTMRITDCDTSSGITSVSLTSVSLTSGSPTLTCASTTNVAPGMLVQATGLDDKATVLTVVSGTQLTLDENSSATNSGLTAKAFSVGLWVDDVGAAHWSGGVLGGMGYDLYGSGENGALVTGEDLHLEGTAGTYVYIPVNGGGHLLRTYCADAGATYIAFVQPGASFHMDGVTSAMYPPAIFAAGRGDVQATNSKTPVDVNWNNVFHYNAMPWHTASYDDAAGSAPFWPAASASSENQLVSQAGFQSAPYRTKLWQCLKTGASTWAWQVINELGPKIVSSGDVTAQSAAASSIATYTTPNDFTVHSFRAGAYASVTAISSATLTEQVTFTDENGTAQTITYGAGITATGFNAFAPLNIRCNPNTAITVKTNFSGTSITYDAGGTIESLY